MEILIKVGSKYPDINDARHFTQWRDGQIIDIRADGVFTNDKMSARHHAVIQIPNLNFSDIFEQKKYKSSSKNGKFKWQKIDSKYERFDLKRNYFIDFTWLLNNGYITLSQFESVYDKSRKHIPIVLENFESIIRQEKVHERLSAEKDTSAGTIAAGTHSIGFGLDYATLTAFEADIAATLTGDLTGEHANEQTSIDTDVNFNVATGVYLLKVCAASGAEHNGGAYGNGARIALTTYDSIQVDASSAVNNLNVTFERLAFNGAGSNNETLILYDGGDGGLVTVNRCVIKGDADARHAIWVYPELTNARITNNIIYGYSNSTYGQGIRWQKLNAVNHYIANNTIAKCYKGIHSDDASAGTETAVVKNNICQGNNTDFVNDGAGYGTTGTNISEDATSPDVAYRSKDLHTNTIFLDYANNDYRLDAAGDATNLAVADDGEDLSAVFTDDVIGTTRAIWYIGAYELEVASSSSSSSSQSVSSSSSSSSNSSSSSSNSSSSSSESTSFSSSSESLSSSSESTSFSSSSESFSSSSESFSSSSESFSSSSESFSSSSSSSFSSSSSSNSSSSSSASRSSSSSSSSSFSSSSSSSTSAESQSVSSSSSSSSVQAVLETDTAIRIAWSGGYQDFSKFEIKNLQIDRIQAIERFWKQTGYVQQVRIGKQYKIIRILLDGTQSGAISKAENVWNQVDSYYQPKQLQLFYQIQIDPTSNIMCQMNRQKMKWSYVAGYRSTKDIEMQFVENAELI